MSQKKSRAERADIKLPEAYMKLPRPERRRKLRELRKGKWRNIFTPSGPSRASRRKKTRDSKYTKRKAS